ncbi:MAG: hypothetical protein FWE89_05675, partial [Syntrophaceae bacterium]|nr:hypothetical protein [Syntrophaceae bacterium]
PQLGRPESSVALPPEDALSLPSQPSLNRLGPGEQALLSLLSNQPVEIDTLIARSGLSAGKVQAGLLLLELAGHIRQLPGKQYRLKES